MNAHNPAAEKFQLTDKPMALPAHCAACGGVSRPVVDFGLSIDYFGAVLLCTDCLGQAARLISYAPVAEIAAERARAQKICDRQSAVEQYLNEKAMAIHDLVADVPRGISDILRTESVDSTEKQHEEYTDDGKNDSGQQYTFESGDESSEFEGSAGVPTNTSSDDSSAGVLTGIV